MAVISVSPGGFSAAYTAAAAGDTLVLQPGTHVFPSSFGKRLIVQASDWAVGKNVTAAQGHNGSGCAVKVTGRQNYGSGARGSIMRGIWFESSNAQSGAGSHLDLGGVGWEDCVFNNRTSGGTGMILITLGSSAYQHSGGFAYAKRCRFHKIGDSKLDHALYFKNLGARDAAGNYAWFDEDCIFYDISGYAYHFYGNNLGSLSRRFVADRCGLVSAGGVVFSGATDTSTGFSSCFYTRNAVLENGIITNTQSPGPTYAAIESYWGCTVGSGNVVRSTNVNQASGTGARIKGGGSTLSGVSLSGLLNEVPGYVDATGGNFTLTNAALDGYGPTYIQRSGAPSPPPAATPLPVSGFTATGGLVSGQIGLSWTNPGTFDDIVIRRGTTTYPATPTDGVAEYAGTGTSDTVTGLSNGTTYRFSAFTRIGTAYSAPAQAFATPSTPVVGGSNIAGKTTTGTAGWKGMSPDVKRGWLYPFGANKRIVQFRGILRGTATAGSASQPIRAFVYDATAGVSSAMPLLGVSTGTAIALLQGEAEFSLVPASPIVLPAAGGQMVIGWHTGPKAGTPTPSTAELQYPYDVLAGALHVGTGDVYADGTADPWGTLAFDTAHGTMWAVLEDTGGAAPTPSPVTALTAAPGNAQVQLAWTNPTTAFDAVIVRRKLGGYPTSVTDGTGVYDGTGSSFLDTGLPNGTAQFYGLYTRLGSVYSAATQATATPFLNAPPPPPPPDPDPTDPSQSLLASIDLAILLLEQFQATNAAAIAAAALTSTGTDDDVAVSNLQLVGRALDECRRARALLVRILA